MALSGVGQYAYFLGTVRMFQIYSTFNWNELDSLRPTSGGEDAYTRAIIANVSIFSCFTLQRYHYNITTVQIYIEP